MPAERKIAIVVGAGQIGEAIAVALSGDYQVALIDIDPQRLDAVRKVVGADTLIRQADASVAVQVDAAFASIAAEGVVEAVAVSVGTTMGGSIEGLGVAEWTSCIDSCLTSVFLALRASIVSFGEDGGAICVIGSVHASRPQPGFPAYAAAKAGVSALTRQVAAEYGHRGIRANLITPGWTETNHTLGRDSGSEALIDSTPLRTLNRPFDIANSVKFLLSAAAGQITGADLVVDGGAHLFGAETVLRDQYRGLIGLN